jgi:teichuronic acid biosynthesis glycosyltransferase TuaG
MPTYNHAEYVGEAISSVLNQTYKNLELIIVDNFSIDNTEDIVSKFAEKDSRIKYEKFNNQGIIAFGRNKGIELSAGEYIAFIDSDDLWKPNKLEKQMPLFENTETGFVCSQFESIESDGKVFKSGGAKLLLKGDIFKELLEQKFGIPSSSAVVRGSILDKYDIKQRSGRQGTEDWDFWLNVAKHTKLDFVTDALMQRRYHGEGVSRNLELMYKSGLQTIRDIKSELSPDEENYLSAVNGEALILNNYISWLINENRFDESSVLIKESVKLNSYNLKIIKLIIKQFLKKTF